MLETMLRTISKANPNDERIPALTDSLHDYTNKCFAVYQLRQKNDQLPTLEEVKEKIAKKFPFGSRASILTQIYVWWPMRDNLQLRINGHKIEGYEGNYIDLRDPITIGIRKSKCLRKPVTREVPKDLADEMVIYAFQNNLKDGDYMFGNGRLNKSVSAYFRQCGVDGGINLLRRIHATTALNSGERDQIYDTAVNSFHSVKTALMYTSLSGVSSGVSSETK